MPKLKDQKLRHNEYYDMQDKFDELYAKSKEGFVFKNLMEIIQSDKNIKLAYRNIKNNSGKIVDETEQSDGSIMVKVIKQYNSSPVGNYLD